MDGSRRSTRRPPATGGRRRPRVPRRGPGHRHRAGHAARVLGRGGRGHLPAARRRRRGRPGAARRAAAAHLRRGVAGAGPPRGRPLRQRRVPRRRRRAARRGQRGRPGAGHPVRARDLRAAAAGRGGAQGHGRRARRGPAVRRRCASCCRPACRATTSPSTSTSSSSTAPAAPTSTSAASRAWPPRPRYATFLLYSLFHSGVLGAEAANTKALIFNVKGEDLLFLDHANVDLERRPAGPLRPPRPAGGAVRVGGVLRPAGARRPQRQPRRRRPPARRHARSSGRIEEFCAQELLPFLFADAEDDRQQYTMVVHNVAARLRHAEPVGDGAVNIDGQIVRTLRRPGRAHRDEGRPRRARPVGRAGHRRRHRQRLPAPAPRRPVATCATSSGPTSPGPTPTGSTSTAPRSRSSTCTTSTTGPSGSWSAWCCGQAFERKERSGQARPLQFVVLDELNKYAPRDGSSPIKEILLDVAERGRSLGIILIGAQQTASEVERRVVANSAIRVVGPARLGRGGPRRVRLPAPGAAPAGHDRQAGHDARVASPSCRSRSSCSSRSRRGPPGRAGSTWSAPRGRRRRRRTPATAPAGGERLAVGRRPVRRLPHGLSGGAVRLLHTSDWHVGKAIRGRSRAAEHEAVLAEIAGVADARGGRPRDRGRRPVRHRRPHARVRAHRLPGAARPGRRRPPGGRRGRQPRLGRRGWRRWRRCRRPAASRWPRPSGRRATAACSRSTAGGEVAQVALLPFPSQRYVVTADVLLAGDAADAHAAYADRVLRILGVLTAGFRRRHGQPGGRPPHGHGRHDGRRRARRPHRVRLLGARPPPSRPPRSTWRSATCTGPSSLPGPAPLHYCGSPLQLDFGETANEPAVVNVVDVRPGQPAGRAIRPADVGRRLRTLRGTLVDVLAAAAELPTPAADVPGDGPAAADAGADSGPWPDHLRVVLDEAPRAGLADEVRERVPDGRRGRAGAARPGRRQAHGRPRPAAPHAAATCSPSTSPSTTSPTTGWSPCSTSSSSR